MEQNEAGSKYKQLRKTSRFLAAAWASAEWSRIVAACLCFIGPFYVLVLWLFDWLRHVSDPARYPNTLKEWSFYVTCFVAFPLLLFPAWRILEHVQRGILLRLETPSSNRA